MRGKHVRLRVRKWRNALQFITVALVYFLPCSFDIRTKLKIIPLGCNDDDHVCGGVVLTEKVSKPPKTQFLWNYGQSDYKYIFTTHSVKKR